MAGFFVNQQMSIRADKAKTKGTQRSMPLMKIVNRFDGTTIIEAEAKTLAQVVALAIAEGKSLTRADLYGADLYGADLKEIREDVLAVLATAPAEVAGLRAAIVEGRIDGSQYAGECCCLLGTIANIRGCDVEALNPNSGRPSEWFFTGIERGDTPETNQVSRIVLGWVDEFLCA